MIDILKCVTVSAKTRQCNNLSDGRYFTFFIVFVLLSCKFIFVCLFSSDLIQTAAVPHQISLTVTEVGGNVTLRCSVPDGQRYFIWYKQSLGYMVQTVAAGTYIQQTLTAQFNSSRFKVTKGDAEYFLTIRNVSKEDEATYFCQTGEIYLYRFVNGTFLAVKGKMCYFPCLWP